MSIEVTGNDTGGEVTLTMGKSFDFNCVNDFRAAYESIKIESGMPVIIDMRSTHYMDSSALGMLINMHKFLSAKSVVIKIVNSSEQIKKIFTISRFDKKFQID